MCVWCAYTGKKQAAPILWEGGRRIEGLWSGFYTGLVTLDQGKFHWAKTEGWSKYWLAENKVEDFHGTCGLFHSRTASTGDRRWAHPFIGINGLVATVSQGNNGIFKEEVAHREQAGNELLDQGIKCPSAAPRVPGRDYPNLKDGTQIHTSDLFTQLIEREYIRTKDPLQSIRKILTEFPEEASSIVIFKDFPDAIFYGVTNTRVMMTRYEDGVFLSITPLATDHPYRRYEDLPANSVGFVTPSRIVIEPLSAEPVFQVSPIFPNPLRKRCVELLKKGPLPLNKLCDLGIKFDFPGGLNSRITASYKILESLLCEGEAELVFQEKVWEGITGREDLIRLK